jgi:hypoxanthine-guanine phosphoribosyltransferase
MESKIVQVHDRYFKPFIGEEAIQKEVSRLAREMNHDLTGKDPIFLGILNGAFMFASEL